MADKNEFEVKFLQSDVDLVAKHQDLNLVNPWGIVIHNDRIWVANNGTGTITNYNLEGKLENCPIRVLGQTPTGMVLNKSHGFKIKKHDKIAPSRLIIVTE